MRTCPKCGATAADNNQAFCLMDGTPLVDTTASDPTVVMNRSDPTVTTRQPPKRKTGLWIALVLIGLLILGGVIGLLMFAAYRIGSQSATVNVNTSGPTPRPIGTSKPTPQTTPSSAASPETTPSPGANDAPSSGEPTPISWTTNPNFVKTDPGNRYSFECPPDGTAGTVWGSDVYTTDSSICTAAVHAGKITFEKGGVVTIEFTGGRQTYGATTRNGVTTYNYGQYPHSFVFKDAGDKKE